MLAAAPSTATVARSLCVVGRAAVCRPRRSERKDMLRSPCRRGLPPTHRPRPSGPLARSAGGALEVERGEVELAGASESRRDATRYATATIASTMIGTLRGDGPCPGAER